MLSLFSLVPPGQIVFASDAPYGHTAVSAAFQLRSALQVGLTSEQIKSVASGQSLRMAAGEPLQAVGPAVGEHERAPHVLLDRVSEFLLLGAIATMRGTPEAATEMLALGAARLRRPGRHRRRPDLRGDRLAARQLRGGRGRRAPNRRRLVFLILAATVARTPEVPVPAISSDSVARSAGARSA